MNMIRHAHGMEPTHSHLDANMYLHPEAPDERNYGVVEVSDAEAKRWRGATPHQSEPPDRERRREEPTTPTGSIRLSTRVMDHEQRISALEAQLKEKPVPKVPWGIRRPDPERRSWIGTVVGIIAGAVRAGWRAMRYRGRS